MSKPTDSNAMVNNSRTAWVISTRHKGNENQLSSIADRLPHVTSVKVIHCESRFNSKLVRPLYRVSIKTISLLGADSLIAKSLKSILIRSKNDGESPWDWQDLKDNDVIISKTPKFEFPLALMSSGSDRISIFMGTPSRTKNDIDVLISTPSTPAKQNNLFLEVLPGKVLFDNFKEVRKALFEPQKTVWSLIIGGPVKGYDFNESDWNALADYISFQAKTYNIHWVISTSPRTPKSCESILESTLGCDESNIDLHLWGKGARKNITEIMAPADIVFITEESVSMLSEAINTRLPVISLQPSTGTSRNSLVTPFINYHSAKNSINQMPISDLFQFTPSVWIQHEFKPIASCWSEAMRNLNIDEK